MEGLVKKKKLKPVYPKKLKSQAKILGIEEVELQCSLDNLKRLAKKRFRREIKRRHPDSCGHQKKQLGASVAFLRTMKAKKFFEELTEEWIKEKKEHQRSFQPLPSPDYPWDWRKEIKLPFGFHETKYIY